MTAPDHQLRKEVGTLVRGDRDSVTVAITASGDTARFPLASLTRLEVTRGLKGNAGRGAGIGFLTGAVIGAAIGASEAGDYCTPGGCAALVGGVFGLGGLVLGAVVGATIKTERWEELPLSQLRVGVAPHDPHRWALGVSFAF